MDGLESWRWKKWREKKKNEVGIEAFQLRPMKGLRVGKHGENQAYRGGEKGKRQEKGMSPTLTTTRAGNSKS